MHLYNIRTRMSDKSDKFRVYSRSGIYITECAFTVIVRMTPKAIPIIGILLHLSFIMKDRRCRSVCIGEKAISIAGSCGCVESRYRKNHCDKRNTCERLFKISFHYYTPFSLLFLMFRTLTLKTTNKLRLTFRNYTILLKYFKFYTLHNIIKIF